MPSYTDSFHFPHHNAPLADLISPIHHLDDDDPSVALRTASADQFFLRAKDMGVSRRRTSTQFNEAFACDEFRMYDYKVRRCMRGRSHDWTDCPFAHPGEKARRRDPRKIHYSGVPCPDFRKGGCQRGDACEFAHGVFECWLHPARYRTQPCKDGKSCMRRVCFFAHSMQQLRYVAVPLEESLAERAIHAHGLPSRTHEDLGAPVRTSYEHEVGLLSRENSDADFISAGTLSSNSGSGADSMLGMSAEDVYASVGSISETLSMLTLTSQNVSSLPFEVVNSMGLSSINTMGVPTEVHSPSLNIPPVASFASSRMGAIFQNDSLTDEWSSAPEILSSASSLQLYTPVVGSWSSSNIHTPGEHSSHMVESPSQQAAAWQNFLMHEGYSRGESTFSANADEFLDMVHHGGYGDTEMLHGYLNASGRRRRDANELNGAAKSMSLTDQWALLRRETCEFSSYNPYGSYGLSSPTSTLAAAPYPSPFSSPPLSPLSAPSIETCNVFSSRCHGNMQADDTGPMADIHIQNSRRMKELEGKHTFTNQQLPLDSHNCGRLLQHGNVKKALHRSLESPSVSECTSGQNKSVAPCNNRNSEYTCKCDASQQTFDDIDNRFGGDSAAENAMPDLGWVHELVM